MTDWPQNDTEPFRWEYSNPCHLEAREAMSAIRVAFRKRNVDHIKANLHSFRECLKRNCWNISEIIVSAFRQDLPEVVVLLHSEGWPVELDAKLTWMAFENKVTMVDLLCRLGAKAMRPFDWDFDSYNYLSMLQTLLEHNAIRPIISFDDMPPILGGRSHHQLNVMVHFDADACKMVDAEIWNFYCLEDLAEDREVESGRVLEIVNLYWRNGASLLVAVTVSERLSLAGPRIKQVLELAFSPHPLKSLCRKAIRGKMPVRHYKNSVGELDLPNSLLEYLRGTD